MGCQVKKVLLVEDDIEIATLMDRVLRSIDSDVILDWITSGEDAIHHIENLYLNHVANPYDLVISDIYLDGGKTGFDLLEVCLQKIPETPFILTSSNDIEEFSFTTNPKIKFHFLKKPLNPTEVSNVLRKILYTKGSQSNVVLI